MLTIHPLPGFPLVKRGDDLGSVIVHVAEKSGLWIRDRDIIVISQKIVSKSEGRVVHLNRVVPSGWAVKLSKETGKDARLVEVILRESKSIVKMKDSHLIVETHHGLVCANAGVDQSNIADEDSVSLLPKEPDRSAEKIRRKIERLTGSKPAVIISDTFGRPWRLGHVNFAIGIAGMPPFRDYRGKRDMFGYVLRVTTMATADELTAAAELVMNKADRIPVAIIRGYSYARGRGRGTDLIRPLREDLFR